MNDCISRQAVDDLFQRAIESKSANLAEYWKKLIWVREHIKELPSVNPQEPKTGWNNHQIACMLADLFGDACACNYNGIDEWLGELCDFKDTCCPNPVGVACWEQFLKYSQSRYTECGYEVRDKNALQEPKTGHWSHDGSHWKNRFICSECGYKLFEEQTNYCPNCGARMFEPQESEEV